MAFRGINVVQIPPLLVGDSVRMLDEEIMTEPISGIISKVLAHNEYDITCASHDDLHAVSRVYIHKKVPPQVRDVISFQSGHSNRWMTGMITAVERSTEGPKYTVWHKDGIVSVDADKIRLHDFKVGEYVDFNVPGKKGIISGSGRVLALWMCGLVINIQTENGKTLPTIPRYMVRSKMALHVGQRIEARWGIIFGGKKWLPGIIKAVRKRGALQQFSIKYDDGSCEVDVDRSLIRIP